MYGNIYNSMRRLYNYSKAEDASITQHKEKLDGLVKIVDQFGDLADTSVLLSQDVEVKKAFTVAQKVDPSTEEGQKAIEAYNNAKDKVKQKYIAYTFIDKLDDVKYKDMKTTLANDF